MRKFLMLLSTFLLFGLIYTAFDAALAFFGLNAKESGLRLVRYMFTVILSAGIAACCWTAIEKRAANKKHSK